MDELTPDQLEAILGTDYETVLADLLRKKGKAEDRQHDAGRAVGQLPNGHVFFDPGTIISNSLGQYRGRKDAESAQKSMDETLAKQNANRKTYAELLLNRGKPAPTGPPRAVDSTIPGQAPPQAAPPPVPGMAPGAPPALANASQMPPSALQGAGVPPEVQALLAKLRAR